MKKAIGIIFISLLFSFPSCTFSFFRGLAGPTYIKCYNKQGDDADYKKALNALYYKHPENIIDYKTIVNEELMKLVAYNINSDTAGSSPLEKEKYFFHWKDKNSSVERWRIKTSNKSYYFMVGTFSCDENNLDCSPCIIRVYDPKAPKEVWQNQELTSEKRKAILQEFENDILPKLKKILEEEKNSKKT